jgi:hypothetical protein
VIGMENQRSHSYLSRKRLAPVAAAPGGTAVARHRFWRLLPIFETDMKRPQICFNDDNIWLRLRSCATVAQAHGWHPNDIINFTTEVQEAFTYEEAMAIIEREFDVSRM